MTYLRIEHESLTGDVVLIRLTGEADVYTSCQLREFTYDMTTAGNHQLIFDLSNLGMLDSTGLGVLTGALIRCRRYGGYVAIVTAGQCLAGRRITNAFRVSGLSKVFPIFDTPDEALADLISRRASVVDSVRRPRGTLRLEHEQVTESIAIVRLIGELNKDTVFVAHKLIIELESVALHRIVFDLSKLEALDSRGLGSMVGALKRCRNHGGHVALVITTRKIGHIFNKCHLYKVFSIFTNPDNAIAALLTGEYTTGREPVQIENCSTDHPSTVEETRDGI